jgi:hypothetical protein
MLNTMHNTKDMLDKLAHKAIKHNMDLLPISNSLILIKNFNKTQILDLLFHSSQMVVISKVKTFKMI